MPKGTEEREEEEEKQMKGKCFGTRRGSGSDSGRGETSSAKNSCRLPELVGDPARRNPTAYAVIATG